MDMYTIAAIACFLIGAVVMAVSWLSLAKSTINIFMAVLFFGWLLTFVLAPYFYGYEGVFAWIAEWLRYLSPWGLIFVAVSLGLEVIVAGTSKWGDVTFSGVDGAQHHRQMGPAIFLILLSIVLGIAATTMMYVQWNNLYRLQQHVKMYLAAGGEHQFIVENDPYTYCFVIPEDLIDQDLWKSKVLKDWTDTKQPGKLQIDRITKLEHFSTDHSIIDYVDVGFEGSVTADPTPENPNPQPVVQEPGSSISIKWHENSDTWAKEWIHSIRKMTPKKANPSTNPIQGHAQQANQANPTSGLQKPPKIIIKK